MNRGRNLLQPSLRSARRMQQRSEGLRVAMVAGVATWTWISGRSSSARASPYSVCMSSLIDLRILTDIPSWVLRTTEQKVRLPASVCNLYTNILQCPVALLWIADPLDDTAATGFAQREGRSAQQKV